MISTRTKGLGNNGAYVDCPNYSTARGLGDRRTRGDYPNYNITENGQNAEKSAGNLRKLAVTRTPVENHLPTLMRKNIKE